MSKPVNRYSDEELEVFKALINKKLEKASQHFASLQEQILEITENSGDEHGGDWVDDSSINNEMEMLNNMAIRQRLYIQDLQNALVRIRNKTYGICVISGELIDQKRLLAVPTTTKSMMAKTNPQMVPPRPKPSRSASSQSGSHKVISKVIRKSSGSGKRKPEVADEDDLDLDFYDDDEIISDNISDLDEIPDQNEEDDLDL